MQCADIFFLEADICQLGMDRRKVNVLAREYCNDIKRNNKPIIVTLHASWTAGGTGENVKNDPFSSIFMEDEEAEVNVKIRKGYWPPKIVEGNPCLEDIKYIVFPWFGYFGVVPQVENGGTKIYNNMEELILDYESGALHPADLKPALSKALNVILQQGREDATTELTPKFSLKKIWTTC
ncbi:hypothetical protein OPV22_028178 [Ensete ventricosum]|uniref:tyrosine--tRNA ligase n=1 Tax=Ensete ventricosum TaxID=4639 RepID=A0AAV8PZP1_ENSVE|nr:hypothetical protein OPV22_028178 [Ensete ventricosum]